MRSQDYFALVLNSPHLTAGKAAEVRRSKTSPALPSGHRPCCEDVGNQQEDGRIVKMMKAVVFRGRNELAMEERPLPVPRGEQAAIRITTTHHEIERAAPV